MKKRLLINAMWGDEWIGGLYYTKNILFSITQNMNIMDNYEILVRTLSDNGSIFSGLVPEQNIIYSDRIDNRIENIILRLLVKKYSVKFVFPFTDKNPDSYDIAWIPDFQHLYYPDFFSSKIINSRDSRYNSYKKKNSKVVLSSESCKKDYIDYYSADSNNIYIMHFVSYIADEIKHLNVDTEQTYLSKHNLKQSKYAVIMNQFWQHKNHIVVLKAIKELYSRNPDSELTFVFTGKLDDYRSPEYIEELKSLFDDSLVKDHAVLLGFIEREEQIAIMKNAEFVIQPSLFEGWGTVVEDAKVLDKTILLSDIPVHHEQMNEKCILFNPHDPIALAILIEEESQKEHHDDVEKGIADMYKRAKEYSIGFQELLGCQERIIINEGYCNRR